MDLYPYTSIYIHKWINKYIYIYKYIFIHIHSFTSIYIHIHPRTSIYIHVHPYTSTYIHIHPYSSKYIHMHPFLHPYTSIYIHLYIQVYPYTSKYIHIPIKYHVIPIYLTNTRIRSSGLTAGPGAARHGATHLERLGESGGKNQGENPGKTVGNGSKMRKISENPKKIPCFLSTVYLNMGKSMKLPCFIHGWYQCLPCCSPFLWPCQSLGCRHLHRAHAFGLGNTLWCDSPPRI